MCTFDARLDVHSNTFAPRLEVHSNTVSSRTVKSRLDVHSNAFEQRLEVHSNTFQSHTFEPRLDVHSTASDQNSMEFKTSEECKSSKAKVVEFENDEDDDSGCSDDDFKSMTSSDSETLPDDNGDEVRESLVTQREATPRFHGDEEGELELLSVDSGRIKLRLGITMDSGAAHNVMPRRMVRDQSNIRPSEGSRRGAHYVAANDGRIPNEGEYDFSFSTAEGTPEVMTFQIAEVKKALGSIS